MIAEKWDISRDDMEAFALESHERAIAARDEGRFEREIVPLGGVDHDEGPRDAELGEDRRSRRSPRAAGSPRPCASQISDGSAAMLIASRGRGRRTTA